MCAFSIALFCAHAFAQPPAQDGWRLELGGGALVSPTYEGDDNYRLSLLPNIRVKYGERFLASIQDGVSYAFIDDGALRAGPIARLRFARDEDGSQPFAITGDKTNDLLGLGDVAATAELGVFVSYEFASLSTGIEARKGVNGHDGSIIDFSLRYGGQSYVAGPPIIYSFGPRVKITGDNYNDAYFGVTPAQTIASALPVYDPDGGLHSYGVGATAILPLSRNNKWSAVFIAGYDRLSGDVGDAPLIQLSGDRDQASIGLFLSYSPW